MRSIKFVLEVSTSLLVMAAVLFGLLVWRLIGGPIYVDFLSSYVASAFSDVDRGIRAEVPGTVLTWDKDSRQIKMKAEKVTVFGPQDKPFAVFPEVGIHFSLAELLTGGAPVALHLDHPDFTLRREPNGELIFAGLPGNPDAEEVKSDLPNVFNHFLQFSVWVELQITNMHVSVDDRISGKSWVMDWPEISLRHRGEDILGRAALEVDRQTGDSSLNLNFDYAAADGKIGVDMRLDNIRPMALASFAPASANFDGMDFPVTGTASMVLDDRLEVQAAHFSATAQGGILSIPSL